jgi:selenide,water dikinase
VADASHVALRLSVEQIPILENALPYAQQFIFPGGAYDNKAYFQHRVHLERKLAEDVQMLLMILRPAVVCCWQYPNHAARSSRRK